MTLIFPFITLLIGFALGSLIKFMGGWRLGLLALTLLAFYPCWLHIGWIQSSLRSDLQPTLELYRPQLADITATFISTNIALGICAFIAALIAVWRVPLWSTALPLLLGFFYYNIPLNRLFGNVAALDRDLSSVVLADVGLTNLWLFWLSLAAGALLFGYALTRYLEPNDLKLYFPLR